MPNRTTVAAVIASLLAIQLTACGSNAKTTAGNNLDQSNNPTDGNSNVTTPAALTAIAVSASIDPVPAGWPIDFRAIATYSDASTKDVTDQVAWSIDDDSCTGAGATRNEFVTQLGCTNLGPFTVTATDAATGIFGIASFTVADQSLGSIVSISIDQIDPSILVNTSLQLTVSASFADESIAAVTDVVWTSSNTSVVSVDPDGTVHGLLVSSTPVVITATVTDPTNGATFSATTNVYVTNVPHALSYMTLRPGSVRSGSTRVVIGSIFLTSPAVDPKVIALTSSSNRGIAVIEIPSGATIDPGKTSVTFPVTALTANDKMDKVTITATSDGDQGPEVKTARLNVRKGM